MCKCKREGTKNSVMAEQERKEFGQMWKMNIGKLLRFFLLTTFPVASDTFLDTEG